MQARAVHVFRRVRWGLVVRFFFQFLGAAWGPPRDEHGGGVAPEERRVVYFSGHPRGAEGEKSGEGASLSFLKTVFLPFVK
jgi:hypothetical protein